MYLWKCEKKARVIIVTDLKEQFDRDELETEAREKEVKEKERVKANEAADRDRRIVEAASSKVYNMLLESYKLK